MASYPLGVHMDDLTPEQRAAKLAHYEGKADRAVARYHRSLLSAVTGGYVADKPPKRRDAMAENERATRRFLDQRAHDERYGLVDDTFPRQEQH